jgi:hypothetical protein
MSKGMQTHRLNHVERLEALKKSKMASGLIADRFPGVSQIILRMTYYQRGIRPVLMVRTMNFSPNDYAYFHMECMREECSNGGFDLTSVVTDMVRDRKKTVKGKLLCDGKSEKLAPHHASIDYEVNIQTARHDK